MTAASKTFGFWLGIACAVLTVAFTVLMVLDVLNLYHGTLQLVPVLLLAPAYLALMACVYEAAAPSRRLWALLGLLFSVPYAGLVSFNYLAQLTVVPQNPALYPWLQLAFKPDSLFGAIELLGYSWQSLALAAVIPVFEKRPVLKTLLALNGLFGAAGFAADVALANPTHPLTLLSLGVWCAVFPVATVLMGLWLKRSNG